MTRLHQILIGLLAVQLILVGLIFFLPKPGQAAATPLLGATKAEEITSLTIRDDKGTSIKLAKGAAGWILPDAGDFAADSAKITPVTVKLAALKAGRSVAQNEANFKRLQVADETFQRKVEIGTAGGGAFTLYLGSSAGGRATHVRLAGQNDVFIAADLAPFDVDADAASWINASYVEVAQADVTSLTLQNAQGQFVFEKNAQGQWTMQGLAAGEQFSANNFTTALTYASSLRMTRPLGKTDQPAYGMAQPAAVVTLKTKKDNQEKTITLTIGAKDAGDSTYIVKSSESPYYVKVADYSVNELVTRGKVNFLQQPTPAPGATATPK
ncbi:MAG: hypothetical protein QG637_435 [Chloroflexota bacterium]|nr:hypothetical protein [Chloroflexota bacterium]